MPGRVVHCNLSCSKETGISADFIAVLYCSRWVLVSFIWGVRSSDESKSVVFCSLETMFVSEQTPHARLKFWVLQLSCKPCPGANAPEISFLHQQSYVTSQPSWAKAVPCAAELVSCEMHSPMTAWSCSVFLDSFIQGGSEGCLKEWVELLVCLDIALLCY